MSEEKRTTLPSSVTWVKLDSWDTICCKRCGTTVKMNLPWIFRRVVRLGFFFEREHSSCAKNPTPKPEART